MQHKTKAKTKDIIDYYETGYSCEQIATMYDMSRQAVWERLKRNNIKLRAKKILPFIMYNNIKFTPSGNGYYWATSRDKNISLHRYKYIKERGPIPKNWDIHHKDENKLNNNIENLEALLKSEHTKKHQEWKNGNNNL